MILQPSVYIRKAGAKRLLVLGAAQLRWARHGSNQSPIKPRRFVVQYLQLAHTVSERPLSFGKARSHLYERGAGGTSDWPTVPPRTPLRSILLTDLVFPQKAATRL